MAMRFRLSTLTLTLSALGVRFSNLTDHMKRIITYGTYDLFHVGHVQLLKRARALGDHLTVALSTDEFNAQKGKRSVMSFEARREIVQSIRYVDAVIPERCWEQKVDDIKQLSIDIFVMGDDWKGRFDFLKEYCSVIYLPRTEGVSTTLLKERCGHGI